MPKQTVLVLTQPTDVTVDDVIEELQQRDVDVVRFDLGWFPAQASLTAELGPAGRGELMITSRIGKSADLTRVAGIWYRRPRDFSFDEDLDPDALKFARGESHDGLGGVLRSLDCIWVNHPEKDISAGYKPFQLDTAAGLGLPIPRTLITNNPQAAREFIGDGKRAVIYKTLSTPIIPSSRYFPAGVYTSRITPADTEALDTIRHAPCLLQEYVPKAFEVRVTIMRPRVFAVAIHSPEGTTDWRQIDTQELRHTVYQLPRYTEDRLMSFMDRAQLNSASFDLIVTPENEHVFLEVNPNGQWAWLEDATGLPMSTAMADCLAPFSVARGRRAGTS